MNFSIDTMTGLVRLAQTITKNEAGLNDLPDALNGLNVAAGVRLAFAVAGGVALIIVAYGGLKFVLSQGNPQEVTKAKNTIIDGLIGLAIIVAAGGIVGFVVGVVT